MRSFDLRRWVQRWNGGVTAQPPRCVWLTLDDGPDPVLTERILRVLDRHRVKATFFMIGKKVEAHGSVARRVFEAGHRIGNHTYSHRRLTELAAPDVREEIQRADGLLADYSRNDKIFRPPYGALNATVEAVAAGLGHQTILWDVDATDWDPPFQPKGWIRKCVWQIENGDGGIVLTHDNLKTTAEYYDLFIRRIKAIGSITFGDPALLSVPGSRTAADRPA